LIAGILLENKRSNPRSIYS